MTGTQSIRRISMISPKRGKRCYRMRAEGRASYLSARPKRPWHRKLSLSIVRSLAIQDSVHKQQDSLDDQISCSSRAYAQEAWRWTNKRHTISNPSSSLFHRPLFNCDTNHFRSPRFILHPESSIIGRSCAIRRNHS